MPHDWAPCLKYANVEVAEHVVYPDAKISMPSWVRREDADALLPSLEVRNKRTKGFDLYANQAGRNFVFM